jgi:hypothetical protein
VPLPATKEETRIERKCFIVHIVSEVRIRHIKMNVKRLLVSENRERGAERQKMEIMKILRKGDLGRCRSEI